MPIRIAFFGDVVGRSGREAVCKYVLENKKKHKFDCVIVNGENSAHGFGITQKICDQFFEVGIDAITLGNHTFDQKNDFQLFDKESRLIRPLNYPKGTPGRGYTIITIPFSGKRILIVNLIGRMFMEMNDDPFSVISELLTQYKLGVSIDSIFIDFHAEATAEKVGLARYIDGKVSGVIGSHTHVPTADLQILPNGTGYLSDCGMCGDYNSVIGMDDDAAIKRFTQKIHAFAKMQPAIKEATICGVVLDINDKGICYGIQTIRVGGFLQEQKDCIR
ncbi:MAG: TIGR00282 family metallophosphoesterase [Holosporales bacterium]|jgi:metallophosphoesterase (TIGR00282 family)|nr:TIGR00282 family metallophosphoesterase [Holosporales bacterium]